MRYFNKVSLIRGPGYHYSLLYKYMVPYSYVSAGIPSKVAADITLANRLMAVGKT